MKKLNLGLPDRIWVALWAAERDLGLPVPELIRAAIVGHYGKYFVPERERPPAPQAVAPQQYRAPGPPPVPHDPAAAHVDLENYLKSKS